MSTDLKNRSVCVVDHGLFLPLALKLSEFFGDVFYTTPWQKGLPLIEDCCIGDGFREINRVWDVWEVIDQVDLVVFTDLHHRHLQRELVRQQIPVWGGFESERLETSKIMFLDSLRDSTLSMPKWDFVKGLDNLRHYLSKTTDKWIKLSLYRGNMETWHHVDSRTSDPILDQLSVKFGPLQNDLTFIIMDNIETHVEVGYDGYCIDGKFPSIAVQGYEAKDKALLASVQKYDELPEPVRRVNAAVAPLLKNYRQFFSSEIRVKDGEPYFLDPTCRCPTPSIEVQMELYANLGEIIWHGAHGRLIDPEPAAKFGAEATIQHNGDPKHWRSLVVPDELRRWVKVSFACEYDEAFHIPPNTESERAIGAVVGIGDTMEEAILELQAHVDGLKDQPITVHMEAIPGLLKEIDMAEKQGMEFTDQPMPTPADMAERL